MPNKRNAVNGQVSNVVKMFRPGTPEEKPCWKLRPPDKDSLVQDRLAWALKERQQTQSGLARAVGIRQQSIFYLLHPSKSREANSRYLAQIADALHIDPASTAREHLTSGRW